MGERLLQKRPKFDPHFFPFPPLSPFFLPPPPPRKREGCKKRFEWNRAKKKVAGASSCFASPHLSLLLVSDSLSLEYDSTTDQIEQNPVKSKAHFPFSTAVFILLSNLHCSSLHFILVCGGNFNSLTGTLSLTCFSYGRRSVSHEKIKIRRRPRHRTHGPSSSTMT